MSGIGLKLGSLFLRTLSKPIANALKAQAKEHETFKRICISIAQRIHKTDVTLRMKLLGEKGAKVRPLNDNKAIESGATFLSESFIFSVAGSLILFESWRQRQKALERRETINDDIKTLQYEIEYLKKKLQEYNVRLDDYVPPKDYYPAVLKLDDNGNHVKIEKQIDALDTKVELLDKELKEHKDASKSKPVATSKEEDKK